MASRSLSIVDVDDIRPRKKITKAAPAAKKAAAKKAPVAKTVAPENYISLETLEKERVTLKTPKKVKKTATPKKATVKKTTVKKSKVTKVEEEHDHTHDHDHSHIPLSRVPARPLSGKDKIPIKRHPLGNLLLEKRLR